MSTTPDGDAGAAEREPRGISDRIPRVVDWLVPVVLGLVGLALVFAGVSLLLLADADAIADLVAAGVIESDVFADDALAAVTFATARWSGVGLAVTGVLVWVGALVFAGYRRRNRRQAAATGAVDRRVFTSAFVGAAVTVLASFLPFSPAVGGAVAGYLHGGDPGDAGLVGAVSSLLAVLPVGVVLLFVFGGMAAGAARVDAMAGAILVVSGVLLGTLVAVVVAVALGWLGGCLAGVVTERSAEASQAADAHGDEHRPVATDVDPGTGDEPVDE